MMNSETTGSDSTLSMLPKDYIDRMKSLLGDEYPAFEASYNEVRSYGLRINPLKVDEADIPALLEDMGIDPGDRIPWCDEGYYYNKDSCRAGRSPYHEGGAYYIQEPSAMAVVSALDPQPGERICDLCAAPGGKTTHIAGRMQGKGVLISNEIITDRARILARNVERMGISNCVVTNAAPGDLADRFPGYFHKICVDAPCSGEGMFRKDEDAAGEWSLDNVAMCASRQADILDAAANMVMPGGTLVYSTCTFEPDENERAIARFISRHPDWDIVDTGLIDIPTRGRSDWADGDDRVELTTRIWPHISHGEGHFIAKLVRGGEMPVIEGSDSKKRRNAGFRGSSVSMAEEVSRFLHTELLISDDNIAPDRIYESGEHFFYLPVGIDMSRLRGIRVIRPGLELAEKKKNRFEPSHALAMSLKNESIYNKCNLNFEEACRFLRGESLSLETNSLNASDHDHVPVGKGWVLVMINGVSLGWGKMTGSVLKNHYPKGLRRDLAT